MGDQSTGNNNKNTEPLSSSEKAALKNEIYQDLQLPATSGRIRFFPGGKKGWLPRTVAAAVVLAFGGLAVYLALMPGRDTNDKKYASTDKVKEIRAGHGEMKRITLGDSTVVILNANSTLRYRHEFQRGASREVELEGNAFFTVKKDRLSAPFVIHTGSLAVTVLGTELNVDARSAAAEVALASGKVKVQGNGQHSDVVYLQPGEKIALDTLSHQLVKTKTNPALYNAWTKGEWNFQQTTLEEITGLIGEYYGTQTIFRHPANKRLRINAVLPVSNLENLVSVIARTLQIKIAVLDNQLIVQ